MYDITVKLKEKLQFKKYSFHSLFIFFKNIAEVNVDKKYISPEGKDWHPTTHFKHKVMQMENCYSVFYGRKIKVHVDNGQYS